MTYKIEKKKAVQFSYIGISSDATHTSGGVIPWNTVTHSATSGQGVSIASNVITLQAGEYYLQGSLGMLRTTDTDTYDARFYDSTTNVELTEPDGYHNSISQGYRDTGSLVFQAHLTLTTSTSFYMKSSGAGGTIKSDSSSIFIVRAP